jgi:hypothetical protein
MLIKFSNDQSKEYILVDYWSICLTLIALKLIMVNKMNKLEYKNLIYKYIALLLIYNNSNNIFTFKFLYQLKD